jgi:hypothetical protein
VRYCSCNSLGMRSTNGLTAFMDSDIKKKQHVSRRVSYQMAARRKKCCVMQGV